MTQLKSSQAIRKYEAAYAAAWKKDAVVTKQRQAKKEAAKREKPTKAPMKSQMVFDYFKENPDHTANQAAGTLGVSMDTVRRSMARYIEKGMASRDRKSAIYPFRYKVTT